VEPDEPDAPDEPELPDDPEPAPESLVPEAAGVAPDSEEAGAAADFLPRLSVR
jgi:hypothetical protein